MVVILVEFSQNLRDLLGLSTEYSNKNRNNSGRRVKHSRGGCSTCKQRKIRCPENKPICNRCISDNRVCNYGIQLQWEDDSRKRGIKHGRTTRADRVALSAAKTTTWLGFPRGQGGRYFLNTFTSDIDGKFVVPVMQGLDFERDMIWKRDAMLHITPTRMPTLNFAALRNETLDMDGILFDYYDRSVSHSIVLLDSPTNLFRNLILPLATTNETVMHMVLALSALSLAATGQTQYYPLALRHKQRSMRLIREQIASNAISAANDANVIVILMLSVFEISDNCQVSWSTHLCAAVDLMRLAGSRSSAPMQINSQVIEFVSRFFLVKDALGRSACRKVAKVMHERDPAANKRTWHSETRQVEEQLDTLIQLLPPTYLQHMDALNAEILTPPPTSSGDPIAILLNTSLLIQTAAKLFFQATLRSLNPQTPQARSLITEIIGYTQQLSPTHLRSAHLWSLFVGAVYSTGDDDERVWFLDQFDILEKKSQGLVARGVLTRVKEIVDNVWKRRDLDCDVIGVWESQGDRIGDWEKYVQPLSEGLSLG
uniref:Adhesion and hyphal regulator 1 n=1 Tax=Talaromyces marneffei PM1 TaxID=1077442 RepID=A0A093UMI4_TALMA